VAAIATWFCGDFEDGVELQPTSASNEQAAINSRDLLKVV